jgi:hypothetical protein
MKAMRLRGFLFLWHMLYQKICVNTDIFVFSYFKGHGDGLHLAYSHDGYKWKPLHHDSPIVLPKIGAERIMRDPCVIYGSDERFHLVWTVGWNERGIGYASSQNLRDWSDQVFLPVMEHENKARNCWAPEIFYYAREQYYIIYWSSTVDGLFSETQPFGDDGYNHRIYYVITKDFKSFSETKLLYDAGFNCIDANIVQSDDGFLLFVKNETLMPPQKNIRMAWGATPFEFGPAGEPLTLNHYWAEGPTAIKIKNEWLVYFDKYKINEIGAIRSCDLKKWEDVSHLLRFPHGAQHGFVFHAPAEIVTAFNFQLNDESAGSMVSGM